MTVNELLGKIQYLKDIGKINYETKIIVSDSFTRSNYDTNKDDIIVDTENNELVISV